VTQPLDQRVFLIDEDNVVRDSLKVLLESHGGQVQDFRNANDFLTNGKPGSGGCLVLGYNRLIGDGLELVAKLRSRGITLPVIFIVGGGSALSRAAAINAGAFAFLERPTAEAALIRTVRAALARQNGGKRPDCEPESAEPPLATRP
jgi:FixJ family two-component response regulator